MTRVLLTGPGGFVGSHVLQKMLDHTDWHIVCVDSFRHNGITDRLTDALAGRRERVTVITHDLTAPLSSLERAKIGDLDYIVNVASLCQVDQSIREPESFIRNNVELMLSVLNLARQCSIQQMIQVSTDEVYGPHVPCDVSHHQPSSPYAASKAMQEDVCHAYRRTYGIPITILNSSNMFGERQSQLAFIPRILRTLFDDETLIVHVHNGKAGRRNYTYVGNVADYIVNALHDEEMTDRVQLAGQWEIDNLTLALTIADMVGLPLKYVEREVELDRPGNDDHYESLPASWDATLSATEGLQRTINWAANRHPEWLRI